MVCPGGSDMLCLMEPRRAGHMLRGQRLPAAMWKQILPLQPSLQTRAAPADSPPATEDEGPEQAPPPGHGRSTLGAHTAFIVLGPGRCEHAFYSFFMFFPPCFLPSSLLLLTLCPCFFNKSVG